MPVTKARRSSARSLAPSGCHNSISVSSNLTVVRLPNALPFSCKRPSAADCQRCNGMLGTHIVNGAYILVSNSCSLKKFMIAKVIMGRRE